jgi:ribosome-associated translation inhibitor RaiA
MKQALQIAFLGVEPSEALEQAAERRAHKLDRFCPDIIACRVSIELVDKHRNQGRAFAVRIDVTLPGHELIVGRVEDEDAHVALRDAFDDMQRRVEDTVRRVRGQVKQHSAVMNGTVVQVSGERFIVVENAEGQRTPGGHRPG